MVDKYDEYFESQEANDDSKSDARVTNFNRSFCGRNDFWISGQ